MLHLDQFDIKTGKPVQVDVDGQQQTALKPVENSYLEHWLATNGLDAKFSVACFYESVNNADRSRLEREGKHLVFTSGSDGYFTDRATAQLMTLGSDTVVPIYASDRNSPHNMIAYGGLISSDGVASTALSFVRLLVIDDERRTHGTTPLIDKNGQSISSAQLASLYDKMGDGTMLVSEETMRALQTPAEREQIAARTVEKLGFSDDITAMAQELTQLEAISTATERQEIALARRTVVQFRAASPDLPGIAKGTMASSAWCDRLGVDAIISVNDIKGADQRLLNPGIKQVSDFWINRKAQAQYGEQSVGPQVKYTIPKAAENEFNPRIQQQAEEFAAVAGDLDALSQRYVDQKGRELERPLAALAEDAVQTQRSDWLYEVLTADKYGQLTSQAQVIRGLTRYVRGEWLRLAESGISVPSAMAQPHSQLKPWEVCNKDLPHGAIVAYYRSPFPNVSAAAIAINNLEIIRERDKEAFSKDGVAYLPPWTAKEIAITDFDGDRNGFFVGYQATVDDLPQQLREELASVQSLLLDQQYESARALFERMIQQAEQGEESRIIQADYPQAVAEFASRNASDVKPPQINKQKKEKHSWIEGEAYSAATWRAWEITADNPVGRVANAGMTLQALALEMEYVPTGQKEALVRKCSQHYMGLLEKVKADKLSIPNDDWLTSQKFSPFYQERIEDIAEVGKQLSHIKDPQKLIQTVVISSQRIYELLSDVANGPNALNLQTAVDMAKSSKGIDEDLHSFVMALQYKKDAFRQNKDNPLVYGQDNKPMPTSIEEPVSWNVQAVNVAYSQAQLALEERPHEQFREIIPGRAPMQLQASVEETRKTYNGLIAKAVRNKERLSQRRSADQQPTMQVRATSGKEFTLQEIGDEKGTLPIWRAEEQQPNWTITISKNERSLSAQQRFPAQLSFVDSQGNQHTQSLGFVAPQSASEHGLAERLQPGQRLSVATPEITLHVPFAQQNDTDMLYTQAERCLQTALEPPEGQEREPHRRAVFTELWGAHYSGRNIVMRQGTDMVCDRLQHFTTKLTQVEQASQLAADGPRTVQFANHEYTNKKGEQVTRLSVAIASSNGEFQHLGYVANRERSLPPGTTFMAVFDNQGFSNNQVVRMELMELPMIAQSPSEVAALREGRCHLTFDYEPHSAYGVRAGDIVIAQADGARPVALQVQAQHLIDEQIASRGAERWAVVEQSPPELLAEKLSAARSEGKELWGLNVQPLGTYVKGQITLFAAPEPTQQVAMQPVAEVHSSPSVAAQPVPEKPASQRLWEKYSAQNSGVLAAIASGNPQMQADLDRAMADRAIAAGCFPQDVREAIAQHSPQAQKNDQPEAYAKSIVIIPLANVASTGRSQPQTQPQVKAKAKAPTPARREKLRDSGMEL
jgi:hypothetical protein